MPPSRQGFQKRPVTETHAVWNQQRCGQTSALTAQVFADYKLLETKQ